MINLTTVGDASGKSIFAAGYLKLTDAMVDDVMWHSVTVLPNIFVWLQSLNAPSDWCVTGDIGTYPIVDMKDNLYTMMLLRWL
jgi:hypothetical protein